jgi:plasmid segregation protein ParM
MGAYHHEMLDNLGLPIMGRSMTTEAWGIVEIGYFSTDFILMQNGRWVEKASDGCSGVRVAAEHLMRFVNDKKKLTCDLGECENALQTRVVLNFGQKVDVSAEVHQATSILVAEIHDTATRLLEPFARKLNGVIVAGGGAPLALPQLKAKWPHSMMPQDHRFAVSEGMRRFGLAILRSREIVAHQQ